MPELGDKEFRGDVDVGTSVSPKRLKATAGIGAFDKEPPASQPASIADATDLSSVITAANSILSVLRDNGLIAPAFSNVLSTDFDGSNDFVDLGNDSSLQILNNLSVSLWMKGPAVSLGSMASKWLGAGQRSWFIGTTSGGKAAVFLSDNGSTTGKDYRSSVVASDNTWHHFAFTFATNVLKLYIDGIEDTSVTKSIDLTVNALHNSTESLKIGKHAGGNFYQGRIDEWSIWNVELSAAEISEIYNSGTPSDLLLHSQAANLVTYLRMGDGDTFPTITDNKGSNNGTMTNMDAGDFVADVPP